MCINYTIYILLVSFIRQCHGSDKTRELLPSKSKMEVVKEMKIQSYAVLFGGFRMASKIPKVKLSADLPPTEPEFYFIYCF